MKTIKHRQFNLSDSSVVGYCKKPSCEVVQFVGTTLLFIQQRGRASFIWEVVTLSFGLNWQTNSRDFGAIDLIQGTGDFRLTTRDGKVLGLLYDRHFLQARHLSVWAGFPKIDKFHRRMLRLFQHGLVARAMAKPPYRGSAEYMYGLTRLGLEAVARGMIGEDDDLELAEDARQALTDGWTPPFLLQGTRNNPFHELAVADLCLALTQYAQTQGHPADSCGSRALTEHYTIPGRGPYVQSVSPDAAVWVGDAGKEILVELERSVNPKKIVRTVRKYKHYLTARRQRDAFFREPVILISIDDIHNEQKYWSDPFKKVMELASEEFIEGAIFIPESRWRQGDWTVNRVNDEEPHNLLDVVLGR